MFLLDDNGRQGREAKVLLFPYLKQQAGVKGNVCCLRDVAPLLLIFLMAGQKSQKFSGQCWVSRRFAPGERSFAALCSTRAGYK
ncbi:MAG: hypothetical protein FWG62_04480 [Proteobacteria bacterium]|nr:hypothetical protein [Pseudomonadota bacterium]